MLDLNDSGVSLGCSDLKQQFCSAAILLETNKNPQPTVLLVYSNLLTRLIMRGIVFNSVEGMAVYGDCCDGLLFLLTLSVANRVFLPWQGGCFFYLFELLLVLVI